MFFIFMDLEIYKMTEVRVMYSTLKYCRDEDNENVETLVEEKGIGWFQW